MTISKQQQQPKKNKKNPLIISCSTGFGQASVNTFVLSWRDAQYRPASPSSPLPVNGAITHQGQVLPVSHRAPSSAPSSLSNQQACFCPFVFFTWQNKAAGWLQPDIIGSREVLHSPVLTQEEKHEPWLCLEILPTSAFSKQWTSYTQRYTQRVITDLLTLL